MKTVSELRAKYEEVRKHCADSDITALVRADLIKGYEAIKKDCNNHRHPDCKGCKHENKQDNESVCLYSENGDNKPYTWFTSDIEKLVDKKMQAEVCRDNKKLTAESAKGEKMNTTNKYCEDCSYCKDSTCTLENHKCENNSHYNYEWENLYDNEVVCPYCGAQLGDCDAWEWTSEEEVEEECRKCGKEFIAMIEYSPHYSSRKLTIKELEES